MPPSKLGGCVFHRKSQLLHLVSHRFSHKVHFLALRGKFVWLLCFRWLVLELIRLDFGRFCLSIGTGGSILENFQPSIADSPSIFPRSWLSSLRERFLVLLGRGPGRSPDRGECLRLAVRLGWSRRVMRLAVRLGWSRREPPFMSRFMPRLLRKRFLVLLGRGPGRSPDRGVCLRLAVRLGWSRRAMRLAVRLGWSRRVAKPKAEKPSRRLGSNPERSHLALDWL